MFKTKQKSTCKEKTPHKEKRESTGRRTTSVWTNAVTGRRLTDKKAEITETLCTKPSQNKIIIMLENLSELNE